VGSPPWKNCSINVSRMLVPHPLLQHVVFAVAAERVEAARAFLEALGFSFQTHVLDDHGLRVTLNWDRGIELVTPVDGAETNPGSVSDFLARRGDGVYSVVVRVDDADVTADLARRYGASVDFRQDRSADGLELVEVQLAALFGMPLMLATNLP
jgi:4-hydroxyphenylpyruvate dioxygenase-like putative hemolysin